MLGKILGGRYQLNQHLGGGGFGQTYLAADLHLPGNPACVVKQLKPRMTDPDALQTARRLFDTEAEVLYTLGNHDQIPRLFAHFNENQDFFLVQEFIEGETLTQELEARKQFPEAEVLLLLQDLLTVLEFVHQQQVVHRDIKPSNLIRRQSDRRLVLIDFGAVKQIGAYLDEPEHAGTVTIAVGSSGYMPNEQLAGKPRFSSDIYAIGMLAIQCLTGVYPKRLREDPATSEIIWRDQVQVRPALADLIDIMVRYDHRQRYGSAQEALTALRTLTDVAPVSELLSEAKVVSFDGHLAWLERGDELFQLQRYQEAVTAYDKVIQAQAEDYLAWFKRGIALDHLNSHEDAFASYDQVVQLQPDDYLAWYKRSNALENLQRYPEALQSYDRVVELQPENYWAWQDRGKVLEQLRQPDAAIASYDRAVQLKPDFQLAVDSRKRLLSSLQRVDALYHLQHYDEAVASCDRAIQANPEDALAWLMRGMALENQQQFAAAVADYDRVVELQPDDHVAWFKRGNLLEKLHREEDAIASYYKVIQIQPENYWAWHDRGRLLEKLQRYEEAIASYDRAHQLKPDLQAAVDGRRRVLAQLQAITLSLPEEEDETIVSASRSVPHPASLRQATAADLSPACPTQTSAAAETVATFISQAAATHEPPVSQPTSVFEEATQVTTGKGGCDSASEYRNWLQKGRSLEKVQRYPEALAAYDRALTIQADDADLWRWRGNILYGLSRYEAAVLSYDRARQLQPENADLWCCLGRTLARMQRFQEAVVSFDRAIQLQPNAHTLWYWRGRVLCELKQYAEAMQSLNQALALKPDFQPAVTDRQKLQTLFQSLAVAPIAPQEVKAPIAIADASVPG